ncbi:hypothetical protein JCM10212_003301 [Sporobolomyces blumeae]
MATDQLHFPVFHLVSTSRSTYGLRHQDYARYKSHCAAKVHHLRKSTGFTQTAGRSRKYQRKDVTADKVTTDKHLQIILFDSERCWAQSQLLKAELEDPSCPPSTKHHLAKRLAKASANAHHLVELSRDPKLATRLSASHVGQIQAYYLVLTGTLEFERAKYEQGLETLSVAYEVLHELAATSTSATDEALVNEVMDEIEPILRFCAYKLGRDTSSGVAVIAKEVATNKLSTTVSGWDDLKSRLEDEGKAGKKDPVEVTWRGQVVPVRNVELVSVAAQVQSVLESLEKDQSNSKRGGEGSAGKRKVDGKKEVMGARRMGTYDKALLVLGEAEHVASQLVDDNKIALSRGHSARFEASLKQITLFHSYVQYYLLSVRAKRDLLLIAATASKLSAREAKARQTEAAYVERTGARDPTVVEDKIRRLRTKTYPGLVKVFDTVLLSLEAIQDMDVVGQDDELATKVEARIEYVRAQRCLYQSRGYALAARYSSSLALNARAKIYSRQARSIAQTLSSELDLDDDEDDSGRDPDFIADLLPLVPSAFDETDRQLEADHVCVSKEWFEATGGEPNDVGDDAADRLRVDALSLDPSSSSSSKSKKPAFYDVAYNYVVAFDMEAIAKKAGLRGDVEEDVEEVEEEAQSEEASPVVEDKGEEEQQSTPSKRGWGFGFFGRR